MNGRISKKLRRYSRKYWAEYLADLCEMPLRNRLLFAWHLITKWRI